MLEFRRVLFRSVGVLPTGSKFVEFMEPGSQATQTAFFLSGGGNLLDGFRDDRVDLHEILLQVVLRDTKEFAFSLLEEVVDVV